jgi:hypothetical protein
VSHFAAIGFHGDSPEDVSAVIARAIDAARPSPELGAAGQGHLWWCDDSGAAIAAHLSRKGEVACVTPFFAAPDGGTRWRVRTREAHLDRECSHCSGADCDLLLGAGDELVTRSTVQWALFEPYRSWLARERQFELQVVGFADALALCPSAEALEEAQAATFGAREPGQPREPGKPMRLAEEAFLPLGMFGNEGEVTLRARAALTGGVESATLRTNGLSGRRFTHVRVRTLGGPLDVVAAPAPPEELAAARLVLATVWMVGRPCEPPPMPEPRRWLKKLLG